DFNTTPSQGTMDFDSPAESQFFSTINPNTIEQDTNLSPSASQSSSVGRLWPGAHSQAALAKTQAQQQQQMMHGQRQGGPQQAKGRGKGPQPTDPLVEQKITQLLNSMRAKPSSPDSQKNYPVANLPKAKKDEEEMDEDERLLASEEG